MSDGLPRLCVVTDQLPYPPRNGVTLPVFHYIKRLQHRLRVRVLLLRHQGNPIDASDLEANEALFGQILIADVMRRPVLTRALREVLGWEVFSNSWIALSSCDTLLANQDYLLVSPFSAVAKLQALIPDSSWPFVTSIAAVNDCTTSEYRNRHKQTFGRSILAAKSYLDWLRSLRIARAEEHALAQFDHILLQTVRDKHSFAHFVSKSLARRVTLAPNGIAEELFALEPTRCSRTIAFVAELSGEYRPVANWLLQDFWPRMRAIVSDCTLRIVGRGADSSLRRRIQESANVDYVEYLPELTDVYMGAAVAISPIFKGYGLINKTIEAMAAGLPVIGPREAFNGIDGFLPGQHGVVPETVDARSLASEISALLQDPNRRIRIGLSGRELVRRQFSWDRTIQQILRLLQTRQHY